MLPRHLNNVPDNRKARAPYNFVELPNDIVKVEPESLPQYNVYYAESENRYTGRIKCTLTTESPLYIRCGLTKEEFACGTESKDLPDFFYTEIADKARKPVIPGSSLRGMLRNLIEITTFSKIEAVSDQQHFFFRAVAAKKDDPLANEYKKLLKNVKVGYLVRKGSNWYIQPAKTVDKSSFIWVKERDLSKIQTLIKMNQREYRPQYISVSFGNTFLKSPRRFTKQVSANKNLYPNLGIIVTSGNMLESSDNSENLHRRNHCIVPEINNDIDDIKINDDAIQHYRSGLTDFQKQEPFDQDLGVLKAGRPIFYCEPQNGQTEVTLFGHCPNFRIPYSPFKNGKAASAFNFIPKSIGKSEKIDLADAIFGFIRHRDKDSQQNYDAKTPEKLKALAGRIFIENGICEQTVNDDIWLTGDVENPITPKILSNPKPTTFQHYLVQTSSEKIQLQHYASKAPQESEPGETIIRGHKLYWHKANVKREDIEETDTDKIKKANSQYTKIKPIRTDVAFKFNIHFENLSDIELGAILWILKISADPKYCLSLGMGKPLGMGAVKIKHQVLLNTRSERYSGLFNGNQWLTGEANQSNTASKSEACIDAFEKYITDNIHPDDHPEGYNAIKLDEIPRIQMLLLMLRCDNLPSADDTRYMTIEPNEYKERPVLPTPFQVMGVPNKDNRRLPSNTPDTNVVENPKPKSQTKVTVTPKLQPNKKTKGFQSGDILDAIITKIVGNKVTYEIEKAEQKLTQKEPKQANFLEEGQNVKVEIVDLKDDGSIKKIKYHE